MENTLAPAVIISVPEIVTETFEDDDKEEENKGFEIKQLRPGYFGIVATRDLRPYEHLMSASPLTTYKHLEEIKDTAELVKTWSSFFMFHANNTQKEKFNSLFPRAPNFPKEALAVSKITFNYFNTGLTSNHNDGRKQYHIKALFHTPSFFNHGCCLSNAFYEFTLDPEHGVLLDIATIKNIKAGTEITINYGKNYELAEYFECPICRGEKDEKETEKKKECCK